MSQIFTNSGVLLGTDVSTLVLASCVTVLASEESNVPAQPMNVFAKFVFNGKNCSKANSCSGVEHSLEQSPMMPGKFSAKSAGSSCVGGK